MILKHLLQIRYKKCFIKLVILIYIFLYFDFILNITNNCNILIGFRKNHKIINKKYRIKFQEIQTLLWDNFGFQQYITTFKSYLNLKFIYLLR